MSVIAGFGLWSGLGSGLSLRAAFGMGRLDVVHGGLGAEAEDAHEVDGVGGVPGLVQDPVLPEFGRAEAELGEGGVHDGEGDRRAGGRRRRSAG